MNYQESVKLLTSQGKFHINLGLERMQKLATLFGNPQENLKIIHVAGTNGKGSTCAMIAKALEDNGYKTGLFTSPHIKKYTERIKINFKDISDEDFAKYIELIEDVSEKNNIALTEFEILTMLCFLYFKDNNVDYVVLETGMGGRLDATNIIKNPILTLITSISLDHLDRLGKNIEEIAYEKAGILKPNTPLIISKNNLGFEVIKNYANKINAKIIEVEKDFELIDAENNIFSNGTKNLKLSLKGINQGQNLALVDKACEYLKINPQKALVNVLWNSRFQYLKEKNILVDAAHNSDAVKLLKNNLDIYFANKKRAFLFGVLDTKDYKTIITELFNEGDEVFIVDGFAHNAVSKDILKEEILKQFSNIKIRMLNIDELNEFINYSFEGIKICCGSFYICSYMYKPNI